MPKDITRHILVAQILAFVMCLCARIAMIYGFKKELLAPHELVPTHQPVTVPIAYGVFATSGIYSVYQKPNNVKT